MFVLNAHLLLFIALPGFLSSAGTASVEDPIHDDGVALNMLQLHAGGVRFEWFPTRLKSSSTERTDSWNVSSAKSTLSPAILEQEGVSRDQEDGIAVIVPGFEDNARVFLLRRNIRWLKRQGIPFECTIYTRPSVLAFPLLAQSLAPCKMIGHSGSVTDHLRAFRLNQTSHRWVLNMMDSVEPSANVNLKRMLQIMKANDLSHAAPTFPRYEKHPIMATHSKTPGREVSFIELQLNLFSREYFACLQDHIGDDKRMDWGMDVALPSLCKGKMGLIDEMTMGKRFKESYSPEEDDRKVNTLFSNLVTKFPGFTPADRNTTYGQLLDPARDVYESLARSSPEVAIDGRTAFQSASAEAEPEPLFPPLPPDFWAGRSDPQGEESEPLFPPLPADFRLEESGGSTALSDRSQAVADRPLRSLDRTPDSSFRMLEQQGASEGLEDGIAVIMPGFGDSNRTELVRKNIAWLKSQDVPFDCTIYVYRSEEDFPLKEHNFAPCTLVRHTGYWMDHLRAFPLNKTRRRWILHIMDSIEAFADVKLQRMIDIMKVNRLSHAAPTFPIYHKYPIMAKNVSSEVRGPGRLVDFIELQLDMFSREYFACLQDLISDDNSMGWGMDIVVSSLCEGRMGMIDEMTMWKRFWASYEWTEAQAQMDVFLEEVTTKFPNLTFTTKTTVGLLVDPLDALTNRDIPRLVPPNTSTFRMLERKGASHGLKDGIAVVVPGFGDYDRCELVKQNIAWLKNSGIPFECTIYTYDSVMDFIITDIAYAPCKLIRHPGHWLDHLRAFSLDQTRRRWVLHMMDSIEPTDVNLKRMIEIMDANGLSHAAPTFPTHEKYPVMASHKSIKSIPGREVEFIELQFDVFSREYFACLQDNIAEDNGIGWGMDAVLPALCGGRLGLIDEMTVERKFTDERLLEDADRNMGIFLGEFAAKFPDLALADSESIMVQQLDEPTSPGLHAEADDVQTISDSGRPSHDRTNQPIPRLVPPNTSTFRELEQEGASRGLLDGIAVVMPGIDHDRADSVQKNIEWLQRQGISFECTIYVQPSILNFPLIEESFSPCKLIGHPGDWMDHLRAFPLKKTRRRWVLHMLDSVNPQGNVKLDRMIAIMKKNKLNHAAPTFRAYDKYPMMSAQKAKPGRMVSFIEFQLDLFSREYFACLQDNIAEDNGVGWGMDMVLPTMCNGQLGLIDEMTMVKSYTKSHRQNEADRNMGIFLGELATAFPGLALADRNTTLSQLAKP